VERNSAGLCPRPAATLGRQPAVRAQERGRMSGSAAGVLARMFGAQTGFTDNTHNDRGWGPRSFKDFQSAADEAARSRLYAGIHFGFGVTGGQAQGRCVAERVLALKYRVGASAASAALP